MARPNRLRVARSRAFSLIANSAADAEILTAIDGALREDLPVALAGVVEESAPASPEMLTAQVGSIVGLIGQDWSRVGREEFIALTVGEFLTLPGGLVIDALRRARHRVTAGRMLVAWIFDDVEPRAAKLELEMKTITRLVELAHPAG